MTARLPAGSTAAAALAALLLLRTPVAQDGGLGRLDLGAAVEVAGELLADTDGDGRAELIVIEASGKLRRFGLAADGVAGLQARGTLVLSDPTHCLLTVADIDATPGAEIVVADGTGTGWLTWPAGNDEAPAVPHPLVRRARCTVRTDRPQLRPFVQDLNHDGRLDLLVPTLQGAMPFLQEAPAADGALQFRALPLLPVPISISVDAAGPGLDEEHQASVNIPQVETEDLNGDRKPDLLTRRGTRRAFHLQGSDGVFRAPIEVDLEQFQDSTPKAAVAPGSTIVLGDEQHLQHGDIDGDGIPDFVIAHRRKVWTFLASKDGPQFTKARTQAVADDVSGMLLADLDDDGRADLLTFQVQLPSIGSLILGMVQSFDIDVRAVGYRSDAGAFANTPAWRRTVTLRIPSLLSLLGRQEEILQRFTDIVGKVRLAARGPFAGKATNDLALVRADGAALEFYATAGAPAGLGSANGRRMLRQLLFEDANPVFDLERLFGIISGLVDQQQSSLLGSTGPLATIRLREAAAWRPLRLLCADLDGVPGQEVVVVYQSATDPNQRAYDVLSCVAPKR